MSDESKTNLHAVLGLLEVSRFDVVGLIWVGSILDNPNDIKRTGVHGFCRKYLGSEWFHLGAPDYEERP